MPNLSELKTQIRALPLPNTEYLQEVQTELHKVLAADSLPEALFFVQCTLAMILFRPRTPVQQAFHRELRDLIASYRSPGHLVRTCDLEVGMQIGCCGKIQRIQAITRNAEWCTLTLEYEVVTDVPRQGAWYRITDQ
jgi:hypothetical protein